MPMPAIWRLQLKLTQKLSLAAVFLLGWFVVFTSIMRLVSLPASAKSKEPTCTVPRFFPFPPLLSTMRPFFPHPASTKILPRGLRQRDHLGRNRRRHRHHLRLPPRPPRPGSPALPPLRRQVGHTRHGHQPQQDVCRVSRNRQGGLRQGCE